MRAYRRRDMNRAALALLLAAVAGCQSSSRTATTETPTLEVVAELTQTPGNVGLAPDGRIFLSQHPLGEPKPTARVVELKPDGTTTPFPDDTIAYAPKTPGGPGLERVIGIEVEPPKQPNGAAKLWLLDMGAEENPDKSFPKLVCWNLATNKLEAQINFPPPLSTPRSFIQDFALDSTRGKIYVADAGIGNRRTPPTPALIVVDVATGKARRVLANAPPVMPEDVDVQVRGYDAATQPEGEKPRLGVDPIAIDQSHEWVYFGATNGTALYRVRAHDLATETLTEAELLAKVERYADKPVCDGIVMDDAGNVYVTAVNAGEIGVIGPDRRYRRYLRDPRIEWPDGLSVGPDGMVYVVINQLHKTPGLNGGSNEAKPPYLLAKFKPIAKVTLGR